MEATDTLDSTDTHVEGGYTIHVGSHPWDASWPAFAMPVIGKAELHGSFLFAKALTHLLREGQQNFCGNHSR